ncbi:MAG: hypothetical protein CMA08_02565 [Euryarchaeota archaeon]|nr:hypothetical protein [Euryarchaeota archaeon]
MFTMPPGLDVDETIDVNGLFPFEHGVVTTWIGRRRTPTGHRLVRGRRCIGWVAEDNKGLVFGAVASAQLEALEGEADHVRHQAQSYTLNELAALMALMPHAAVHAVDVEGLPSGPGPARRLLSRSAAVIMAGLAADEEVRGALLVDRGLLIDSTGDLPQDVDALAALVSETLLTRQSIMGGLGLPEEGHWSLSTPQGSVLLASASDLGLGVWTTAGADHRRLLHRVSSNVAGRPDEDGQVGHLPEGFVLRQGKSGPDAVLSMLRVAVEEEVYGHLSVGAGERTTALVLLRGRPVGIVSSTAGTLEDAVHDLTDRARVARLHQLPLDAVIGEGTANVAGFTLNAFGAALASVRTRSEARRATLTARFEDLLGFDAGLERIAPKVTPPEGGVGLDTLDVGESTALVIDAGYRQRLEKAEYRVDELEREGAALQARLNLAEEARMRAEVGEREAVEARGDGRTRMEGLGHDVDRLKLETASAVSRAEAAEHRADRLVRRTTELEHQLETRAGELARALADSSSRGELAATIQRMAEEEATLRADLQTDSERLAEVRRRLEADERHLGMLEDQSRASHERQAAAVRDLAVAEDAVRAAKADLMAVEAEARAARRRADDELERRREDEVRRSHLEGELRELLEERRRVLRELGDLGVKRGQSEAEVAHLADQAEALAEAHESALQDIDEARMLRARLSEEPLAQALLDDGSAMSALGPILERLQHTREQGYSVALLDRAVERALHVVQRVVDHAAETPKHLLSDDVMLLLERQVPEAAGVVRGLTRWSVQQRLDHSLNDVVTDVVLDLEHLLEDQDRAITMLRRTRNVLEQLGHLGAPRDELDALMAQCRRPEALPTTAKATHKLIRRALDDIHLEADQRDAGEAVALERTAQALEELIAQLEAAGMVGGTPQGHLWSFMASGLLPSEARNGLAEAPPLQEQPTTVADPSPSAPVAATAPSPVSSVEEGTNTHVPIDDAEERRNIDAELASLDVERTPHVRLADLKASADPALEALEARLGDIDI